MVTIDWSVNVSVDTVMKGGILGPYIVKEKYVFMASHECQINASTNGLHPTAQEREEKDIGKKNILKIRKQSKLYLLSVVTNSKLDRNQISKVFFPCNVGKQKSFHRPRALQKAQAVAARHPLDLLLGLIPQSTFGGVHDPLKGQIILGRDHQPEIGHRIANFEPLVKAWAADHAVGQADG